MIVLTILAGCYEYVHYQYATTKQTAREEISDHYYFKQNDHDRLTQENSNLQMSPPEVPSTCNSLTKWVVLSLTTSPPATTAAIHSLLNNLTADWCVLVVGDEKCPDELSLNSSRFIYLSVGKQYSLAFEVVGRTPKNTICRKNIGYLYAIMNGAKVILDMESDSIPISLELLIEEQKAPFARPVLEEDMEIPIYIRKDPPKRSESIVWNPYLSDTARPRGFPTDYKQFSINNAHIMTKKTCYPIVQQFLHSDATSKHASTKVVLPHAAFAPYNTRSTVHLHEAFWSLLLPKTVSGLGSDIWRSYIAQSLLYLIPDACVMFTSSTLYHQQNHLNHHHDINSESPITSELLNDLRYLPLRFDTFEDALSLMYDQLHKEGILDLDDVEYVRAWIRDLKGVGYSFPKLPDKSRLWTKNIQLCIMYNYVPGEYYVRELMAYYLRFFDNIMLLFDGKWPEKPSFIPEYVNFSECRSRHGHFQHVCLRTCLANGGRNVEGYLFIADDIFVNLSLMSTLPQSKLWFVDMKWVYDYTNKAAFTGWRWPQYFNKTQLVVNNLLTKWKDVLVKFAGFPKQFHGHSLSDIIYVPQPLASRMFEVLSYIINTTDLFCEIAIPLAVDTVDPQYVHMVWGYVQERNRTNRELITSTAAKAHFVHPLKLAIRPTADIWRDLMAKQLKWMES